MAPTSRRNPRVVEKTAASSRSRRFTQQYVPIPAEQRTAAYEKPTRVRREPERYGFEGVGKKPARVVKRRGRVTARAPRTVQRGAESDRDMLDAPDDEEEEEDAAMTDSNGERIQQEQGDRDGDALMPDLPAREDLVQHAISQEQEEQMDGAEEEPMAQSDGAPEEMEGVEDQGNTGNAALPGSYINEDDYNSLAVDELPARGQASRQAAPSPEIPVARQSHSPSLGVQEDDEEDEQEEELEIPSFATLDAQHTATITEPAAEDDELNWDQLQADIDSIVIPPPAETNPAEQEVPAQAEVAEDEAAEDEATEDEVAEDEAAEDEVAEDEVAADGDGEYDDEEEYADDEISSSEDELEDETEVNNFILDMRAFHNDDFMDRNLNVPHLNVRIDIFKLRELVESKGDFEMFSDLNIWWSIAVAMRYKLHEAHMQTEVALELMDFYMSTIEPVSPCGRRHVFQERFRNAYGDLFHASDRYGKDIFFRSEAFPDTQHKISPWQLHEVIESYGGLAKVQEKQSWAVISDAMHIPLSDRAAALPKLQNAARELLKPLENGNASRQEANRIAQQYSILAPGVASYHGKSLDEVQAQAVKASHPKVDLLALEDLVSRQPASFNRTTDTDTWNEIADQLGVPAELLNRGEKVKRVWRRFLLTTHTRNEAAAFFQNAKTSGGEDWYYYQEGAFATSYENAGYGKIVNPIVLASVVKDLGGPLAIAARENEKYGWSYAVKEIWWDEDEQDWVDRGGELENMCNDRLLPLLLDYRDDEAFKYGFTYRDPTAEKEAAFFIDLEDILNVDPSKLRSEGVVISGRQVCPFTLMKLVEARDPETSLIDQGFWVPLVSKLGLKQQPHQSDEDRTRELMEFYLKNIMELGPKQMQDRESHIAKRKTLRNFRSDFDKYISDYGLEFKTKPDTWLLRRLVEEHDRLGQSSGADKWTWIVRFHELSSGDAKIAKAVLKKAYLQVLKIDEVNLPEDAQEGDVVDNATKDAVGPLSTTTVPTRAPETSANPAKSTKRKERDADDEDAEAPAEKRLRSDEDIMGALAKTPDRMSALMPPPPPPASGSPESRPKMALKQKQRAPSDTSRPGSPPLDLGPTMSTSSPRSNDASTMRPPFPPAQTMGLSIASMTPAFGAATTSSTSSITPSMNMARPLNASRSMSTPTASDSSSKPTRPATSASTPSAGTAPSGMRVSNGQNNQMSGGLGSLPSSLFRSSRGLTGSHASMNAALSSLNPLGGTGSTTSRSNTTTFGQPPRATQMSRIPTQELQQPSASQAQTPSNTSATKSSGGFDTSRFGGLRGSRHDTDDEDEDDEDDE